MTIECSQSGDQAPNGFVISHIFGQGKTFLVYKGKPKGWWKKEGLGAEYPEPLQEHLIRPLLEFRRLLSISKSVLSKSNLRHQQDLLVAALISAFRSGPSDNTISEFEPARSFLEKKSSEKSRTSYLLFTLAMSMTMQLILTTLYFKLPVIGQNPSGILVGAIGGVLGATISVLQRGRNVAFDPFESPAHLAFEGCIRMVLGAIFGSIVVIASIVNIAFGVAHGNNYFLFLLAIGGGFSERLVPDLIESVATDSSTKQSTTVSDSIEEAR